VEFIESRENRAFAYEVKFLTPAARADEVRAWARERLGPDPNAGADSGDTYRITSIYYDTDALDVFHRTGSYGRAKYRIRRYGSAGSIFLERKLRAHGIVAKRRTSVPIGDLARFAAGPDVDWAGHWFERRIAARAMSPTCQISYQRMALIGEGGGNGEGLIRLTLDQDLRASEANGAAFLPHANGIQLLDGQAILEMKFRIAMPPVFKELLQEFRLNPQPVSKYRLAVPVLASAKESAAVYA
jgi:hypothetical protein